MKNQNEINKLIDAEYESRERRLRHTMLYCSIVFIAISVTTVAYSMVEVNNTTTELMYNLGTDLD